VRAFEQATRFHEQNQLAEAINSYEQAFRLDSTLAEDDPDLHVNLALALLDTGEMAAAAEHLEQALIHAPRDAAAAVFLGTARLALGRLDEALHSCQHALKLAPDNPDALSNTGTVLHEQRRGKEAFSAYQQALELNPAHYQALIGTGALILSGEGGSRQEKPYKEAAARAKMAMAIAPSSAAAALLAGEAALARARASKERPEEEATALRRAERELRKALKLTGGMAMDVQTLANTHHALAKVLERRATIEHGRVRVGGEGESQERGRREQKGVLNGKNNKGKNGKNNNKGKNGKKGKGKQATRSAKDLASEALTRMAEYQALVMRGADGTTDDSNVDAAWHFDVANMLLLLEASIAAPPTDAAGAGGAIIEGAAMLPPSLSSLGPSPRAAALRSFRAGIVLSPADGIAHRQFALALMRTSSNGGDGDSVGGGSKDWEESARHLTLAATLLPTDATSVMAHASSMAQEGRYDEARPVMQRAMVLTEYEGLQMPQHMLEENERQGGEQGGRSTARQGQPPMPPPMPTHPQWQLARHIRGDDTEGRRDEGGLKEERKGKRMHSGGAGQEEEAEQGLHGYYYHNQSHYRLPFPVHRADALMTHALMTHALRAEEQGGNGGGAQKGKKEKKEGAQQRKGHEGWRQEGHGMGMCERVRVCQEDLESVQFGAQFMQRYVHGSLPVVLTQKGCHEERTNGKGGKGKTRKGGRKGGRGNEGKGGGSWQWGWTAATEMHEKHEDRAKSTGDMKGGDLELLDWLDSVTGREGVPASILFPAAATTHHVSGGPEKGGRGGVGVEVNTEVDGQLVQLEPAAWWAHAAPPHDNDVVLVRGSRQLLRIADYTRHIRKRLRRDDSGNKGNSSCSTAGGDRSDHDLMLYMHSCTLALYLPQLLKYTPPPPWLAEERPDEKVKREAGKKEKKEKKGKNAKKKKGKKGKKENRSKSDAHTKTGGKATRDGEGIQLGHNLTLTDTNLWLTAERSVTNVHYDGFENVLLNLRGTKVVLLMRPSERRHLHYEEKLDIEAAFDTGTVAGESSEHIVETVGGDGNIATAAAAAAAARARLLEEAGLQQPQASPPPLKSSLRRRRRMQMAVVNRNHALVNHTRPTAGATGAARVGEPLSETTMPARDAWYAANAAAAACIVGENEALFIPAYWSHAVHSYPSSAQPASSSSDSSIGGRSTHLGSRLSLAVNFWYNPVRSEAAAIEYHEQLLTEEGLVEQKRLHNGARSGDV
jgi:tetratricopeptide (TPR) repeat protein